MIARAIIRGILKESLFEKARTNSAKELLKLAYGSRLTCDQRLANSNGDLKDLFYFLLGIFQKKGVDLISKFNEDEEDVFYDFAMNYDKGSGYWKRMGEKIFGDMWGYGTGVDARPSCYDRFMIVSVDDDKVDEAIKKIERFGWRYDVGESSASLEQTAIIVSPVELKMKR